jgi:hypothetical protein
LCSVVTNGLGALHVGVVGMDDVDGSRPPTWTVLQPSPPTRWDAVGVVDGPWVVGLSTGGTALAVWAGTGVCVLPGASLPAGAWRLCAAWACSPAGVEVLLVQTGGPALLARLGARLSDASWTLEAADVPPPTLVHALAQAGDAVLVGPHPRGWADRVVVLALADGHVLWYRGATLVHQHALGPARIVALHWADGASASWAVATCADDTHWAIATDGRAPVRVPAMHVVVPALDDPRVLLAVPTGSGGGSSMAPATVLSAPAPDNAAMAAGVVAHALTRRLADGERDVRARQRKVRCVYVSVRGHDLLTGFASPYSNPQLADRQQTEAVAAVLVAQALTGHDDEGADSALSANNLFLAPLAAASTASMAWLPPAWTAGQGPAAGAAAASVVVTSVAVRPLHARLPGRWVVEADVAVAVPLYDAQLVVVGRAGAGALPRHVGITVVQTLLPSAPDPVRLAATVTLPLVLGDAPSWELLPVLLWAALPSEPLERERGELHTAVGAPLVVPELVPRDVAAPHCTLPKPMQSTHGWALMITRCPPGTVWPVTAPMQLVRAGWGGSWTDEWFRAWATAVVGLTATADGTGLAACFVSADGTWALARPSAPPTRQGVLNVVVHAIDDGACALALRLVVAALPSHVRPVYATGHTKPCTRSCSSCWWAQWHPEQRRAEAADADIAGRESEREVSRLAEDVAGALLAGVTAADADVADQTARMVALADAAASALRWALLRATRV